MSAAGPHSANPSSSWPLAAGLEQDVSRPAPAGATQSSAAPLEATGRRARLPGNISIDMDTLSDYARGYGFPYSHLPDPVYVIGLKRMLDRLAARKLRATIFVIARDAEHPAHRELLQRAVAEGHEIANHTLTHPRRLASLSQADLEREILTAHDVLSELRGRPVRGFRAPCYDVNCRVLELLAKHEYLYDSSVHPTLLTPVIDLAVLIKSCFRVWEARPSTYLHALAPLRPYRPSRWACWRPGRGAALRELPLSALPLFGLPFYGTFIQAAGMGYFRAALRWLRLWRRSLSFHFHAVELVGIHDEAVDEQFAVHPGLTRPAEQKCAEFEEMIEHFSAGHQLVTLEEWAAALNVSKAASK